MATDLINNHGLALMKAPFGTNVPSGNPETWPVERNVIWDLHRGVNITDASNTEMIMPILNYYSEGFISYPLMRAMCVHWVMVLSVTLITWVRQLITMRALIVNIMLGWTGYVLWVVVLVVSVLLIIITRQFGIMMVKLTGRICVITVKKGNWVEMTDLKYNNPESDFFGENMMLYARMIIMMKRVKCW